MNTKKYFLKSNVQLKVIYDDKSEFGSPISDRPDKIVRKLFYPIIDNFKIKGCRNLIDYSSLLNEVVKSQQFERFAQLDNKENWKLRPEVLFPNISDVNPKYIVFYQADTGNIVEAEVPYSHWVLVHSIVAKLSNCGLDEDLLKDLHPDMHALLCGLIQNELVHLSYDLENDSFIFNNSDLGFIGHNTVLVNSDTTSLLIDPLFFSKSKKYPRQYQPIQVQEFKRINAVLITHSHPDHFDPASLLRFHVDTQIIIPLCMNETILSVAMAPRLRELGFSNIVEMDWYDSILVGDIQVIALPFYGEQPTDGEVLHPEIRNIGNTYLVKTPKFSSIFLADSGCDKQGNVTKLAEHIRSNFGSVDFVFSGYRGWFTYPVQHLFTSIARFILFVPSSLWNIRQKIMLAADEAVDAAERLGAKYLIPYADGGAPWHWQIGLGPILDGTGSEIEGFDHFPERVIQASLNRTQLPDGSMMSSIVKTLLLRPNDSIIYSHNAAKIASPVQNKWPYNKHSYHLTIPEAQ